MRVPAKRAGMSARCPGCKSVVVVPFPPADHRPQDLLLAPFSSSASHEKARSPIDEIELPDPPTQLETSETDKIELINTGEPRAARPAALEEGFELKIAGENKGQQGVSDFATKSTKSQPSSKVELQSDLSQLSIGESASKTPLSSMAAIEKRSRQAREDRITLTRFFAGFLVVVGLINLAPAIYCWWQWSQADAGTLLPRWIYLQIFAAVLHIVYATLLLQVPDWGTLQSIAIVMLVFAFIFGLFSVGLLNSSNGLFSQFLQIPGSLSRKACIWCVAMLVLATLASYLAGRESTQWRRTEVLLAQLVAKNRDVS